MEDPWATGPSWGTTAKPAVTAAPLDFPSRSPSSSPAPPDLDSDPWGPPSSAHQNALPPSQLRNSIESTKKDDSWGQDGDSGWGETSMPTFEPSGRSAEPALGTLSAEAGAQPAWSLNSPQLAPNEEEEQSEVPVTVPLPRSPSPIYRASFDRPASIASSSRHTPRSSLDHRSQTFEEEEQDPEEALKAALGPSRSSRPSTPALPNSPSFGDDGFGTFSAGTNGDPWGGGGDDMGSESGRDGYEDLKQAWGGKEGFDETAEGDDAEDGWGGVQPVREASPVVKTVAEEDWEVAQRKLQIQQQRVPREKVEALKNDWKEVSVASIGLNKLDSLTEADEQKLAQALEKLNEETFEKLRSLSTIPPDIDTYPPVINNLTTHERYAYALNRPNPTPTTSLIQLSLARRTRRTENLSTDSPWLSRSKLGEPEAPAVVEAQSQADPGQSRWSFWGRKQTAEKPLVTSGGGILEVKQLSTSSADPLPSPVSMVRPSTDTRATSSRAPSISSKPSRPNSPAPPPQSIYPNLTELDEDGGHDAPGGMVDSTSQNAVANPNAGPSAVTRFFGRLSRKPTSSQIPKATDVDAKDMELSADDFSFLAEVPSMSSPPVPERGIGDLLSMESGRPEEMASLESMLSSRPMPLPQALAPPPRGPTAPTSSRKTSQSASSNKFVARMATQPQPSRPSDMDLLGGLDFNSDSNSTPAPPMASGSTGVSTGSSMWDEFLAPASSTKPVPDRSATPSSIARTASPISSPTIIKPSAPVQCNLSGSSTAFDFGNFGTTLNASQNASRAPAKANDDFGDFGDFADFDDTPQSVQNSSSFSSPAPMDTARPTPIQAPTHASTHASASTGAARFSTPQSHSRNPSQSLDHSHTLSLMSTASSSKGKRWPAPASPIGPILDPPPKADSKPSAGFPFLSPPPAPSRPASSVQGKKASLLDNAEEGDKGLQGLAPSAFSPGQIAGRATPPVQSLQPVAQFAQQKVGAVPPIERPSSAQGLSAQDLSFFDSI